MNYKNVIWDWNGTILNDLDICLETLNDMLRNRNIPEITKTKYRSLFRFPVKDFYYEIGFDFKKESFDKISVDFVTIYNKNSLSLELQPGVLALLQKLNRMGVKQYVLSALEKTALKKLLKFYKISDFFECVAGSDNIYGEGKFRQGEKLIAKSNIDPGKSLMVGDTTHDAEIAAKLGLSSALYVGGHNSKERLEKYAMVINDFSEILTL